MKTTTPARIWWKVWWRQLRIARRETQKAAFDAMFYGIGIVRIGYDVPDFIQHASAVDFRMRPNV